MKKIMMTLAAVISLKINKKNKSMKKIMMTLAAVVIASSS